MNDDLMTAREVAERFGVGPKTVRRWAIAGKIPCQMTIGGHRRFSRQAILKLVESLTRSVD